MIKKTNIEHKVGNPAYQQLVEQIENDIQFGKIKSNEKLPSENEICRKYKVSRTTVREALKVLRDRKIIYTVHGKGSFLRLPQISDELSQVVKFGSTLKESGVVGKTQIFTLDYNVKNKTATKILGSDYFDITLIGYASNIPVVYYRSYVLNEYRDEYVNAARELEKKGKPFSTIDIQDSIGLEISETTQKITAVLAKKTDKNQRDNSNEYQKITAKAVTEKIYDYLKLSNPTALIRIETLYYNKKHEPVELKIAYYRSDVYEFRLNRIR